jgi:hypothetical protein
MKIILMTLFLSYCFGNAFAWDDKLTHPEITRVAIQKSNLDQQLKELLGIPDGKLHMYQKGKIEDLLQDGSTNEDIPLRAYNHFWNPIHNEGLDDSGFGWIFENNLLLRDYVWWSFSGLPNLYWAMGETQDGQILDECGSGDHSSDNDCNDYSWRKARKLYYEALVETSSEIRNYNFISFYEKLGRVLHLLQDVAVPAHTRNDMFGHLDFTRFEGVTPLKWGGNLFEYWVRLKLEKDNGYISRISSNAIIPDFEKKEDYWDRGEYIGASADITLPVDGEEQVGLSEYSNANFLSKCTIFTDNLPFGDSHYFPFPNKDSIEEMPPETIMAEDGKADKVRYLRKYRHGEVINNFAQARYFCEGLYITLTDINLYYRLAFHLDDKVHEAYAEKLIPKAVGFTAGLINYFFRGELEITAPDEYVYALIDGSVIEPGKTQQEIKQIKARIRNNSAKEKDEQGNIISYEPIGQGQLQAVAKYRVIPDYHADLSGDPPTYDEMKDVEYSYSVSAKVDIASLSSDASEEKVFDFFENPIPVGITDLYLQVIFKGTLGNEENIAVAVGMKDLMEPYHLSILNTSDVFCIDNNIYTAAQIKTTPALRAMVDFDHDGIVNEYWEGEPYIDPHDEYRKVAIFSTTGEFSCYQATYSLLPPGRHGNIIFLIDEPEFLLRSNYIKPHSEANSLRTINFQESQFDENGIFYFNLPMSFRGINHHWLTTNVLWLGSMSIDLWYDNDAWPELEDKEIVPMDPIGQ